MDRLHWIAYRLESVKVSQELIYYPCNCSVCYNRLGAGIRYYHYDTYAGFYHIEWPVCDACHHKITHIFAERRIAKIEAIKHKEDNIKLRRGREIFRRNIVELKARLSQLNKIRQQS